MEQYPIREVDAVLGLLSIGLGSASSLEGWGVTYVSKTKTAQTYDETLSPQTPTYTER